MEIADVYILNKADHPGVEELEQELRFLVDLTKHGDAWQPPILRCVASESVGIPAIVAAISAFAQSGIAAGTRRRKLGRAAAGDVPGAGGGSPSPIRRGARSQRSSRASNGPFSVVEQWLIRR